MLKTLLLLLLIPLAWVVISALLCRPSTKEEDSRRTR